MLYLISLYYRKDVVTGANKRFDELGKRIIFTLGLENVKVIVSDNEKPSWIPFENVIFIKKYSNALQRLYTNILLSEVLNGLISGTVISDFMPLPMWGLKKHNHFQLIHDLRSFTSFSRRNVGKLTTCIQSKNLRKSQKIIAVSEFSRQETIELCKVKPSQVIVSYNGVDTNRYYPNENLKRSVDFIYVATFESRKNHIALIDALSRIDRTVKVVFVGRDLGGLSDVNKRINKIDMCHVDLTIIESISDADLVELYNSSKNFISPSLLEGFGMPLIEAALCGCNVICSDIPVFKEIMGDHATYFDPFSIDEITETVQIALNNEYLCNHDMVDYIKRNFCWKGITDNLLIDVGVLSKSYLKKAI